MVLDRLRGANDMGLAQVARPRVPYERVTASSDIRR